MGYNFVGVCLVVHAVGWLGFFLIKMLSSLNLEGSFLASNAHPLGISFLFNWCANTKVEVKEAITSPSNCYQTSCQFQERQDYVFIWCIFMYNCESILYHEYYLLTVLLQETIKTHFFLAAFIFWFCILIWWAVPEYYYYG